MTRQSAFSGVLERLGSAICSGEYPAGTVMTLERVEEITGSSRSIVREASRILVSLGMLRATQRVGLRVLAESEWNSLSPLVIRWRLDSPRRPEHLRQLIEARLALEPEASRAAARARTTEDAERIRVLADELRASATDKEAFLSADRRFHRALLEASHNTIFIGLAEVIDEALQDREQRVREDQAPDAHDLELHELVARAIISGAAGAEAAAANMREIVERTG